MQPLTTVSSHLPFKDKTPQLETLSHFLGTNIDLMISENNILLIIEMQCQMRALKLKQLLSLLEIIMQLTGQDANLLKVNYYY